MLRLIANFVIAGAFLTPVWLDNQVEPRYPRIQSLHIKEQRSHVLQNRPELWQIHGVARLRISALDSTSEGASGARVMPIKQVVRMS